MHDFEYVPNEEWAVEAKRLADEKEAAAQAASNPAPAPEV